MLCMYICIFEREREGGIWGRAEGDSMLQSDSMLHTEFDAGLNRTSQDSEITTWTETKSQIPQVTQASLSGLMSKEALRTGRTA